MEIQDFLGLVRNARVRKDCRDKHDLDSGNLYAVTYYMLERKMTKFVTGENRQDVANKFKKMNRDAEIMGISKANIGGKLNIK